jgi:Gpi18-like mannosyltransferase
MIFAHLGLAYSIGVFAANRFNRKTGLKIFFITLTGSFFIYIGAMWGQINTLSALLTFLAFYAVINQRTRVSALLLGTAITLKIYPLVPLPAFFGLCSQK